MSFYCFLFLALGLSFSLLPLLALSQNDTVQCPLHFSILSRIVQSSGRLSSDVGIECQYIRQGLRLVESQYLQLTGLFLPPLTSSESCWDSYQSLINNDSGSNFDIRRSCGFQTSWISQGCMNITTRAEFEKIVPKGVLDNVVANCNQSLENSSPCASCTTSLSILQASYLTGSSVGNVSDCTAYPFIYAAAFANPFGPADRGTAKCLFSLDFSSSQYKNKRRKVMILGVSIGCGIGILIVILGSWFSWRKMRAWRKERRRKDEIQRVETSLACGLESICDSTTLVRFTYEEIKKATKNFSRDCIIGKGGYGNVYKGELEDGSEVAMKRFKNCSAAGDANFAHEVEVIASIRHINLVSLRGYCIATTPFEGHQRIIVCELMKNGSLHDHLFGQFDDKLSWPIRQNIALGTAKGLAYLHYGAQPAIIHRDIKASNILLDENFEPKVADFGLAKFRPEGMTHLSTRVAGTMGYVAPEYALYGQLTERSDVYSFGVLLLELLSGRKALTVNSDDQPSLVTDWAWTLVREGRTLDVIEDGIPDLGPPEAIEKYILIAVLCSHPQLYARPTMDQVVKMLETDLSVPSIPERPIPIVAHIDDIERSMSSNGSLHLLGTDLPFVEMGSNNF